VSNHQSQPHQACPSPARSRRRWPTCPGPAGAHCAPRTGQIGVLSAAGAAHAIWSCRCARTMSGGPPRGGGWHEPAWDRVYPELVTDHQEPGPPRSQTPMP